MMEISRGNTVCCLSPAAKDAAPVVLTDMKKWMLREEASAFPLPWSSISFPAGPEVMLGLGKVFRWSLTSCRTPAASRMTQWWKLLRTTEIILSGLQNTHRFLTLELCGVSDVLTEVSNTFSYSHSIIAFNELKQNKQ